MSNRVQKYCNDCRTNRRCTTDAAGQGEIAFWFIAGLFIFPLWGVLLWRVIGGKAQCDTCGSTNVSSPR